MVQQVIYGTIVGYETVGTTASGNPIIDVSLEDVHGDITTRRVSHDASLTYDVLNHREDGKPRAYVLTDAGRVSHDDWMVTAAYRRLMELFPRGAYVTTVVTHVSSSGTSRRFRVLGAYSRDGASYVEDYALHVARVLGWRTTDRGELVVSGTGMDMGFHVVYTLAGRLYGDGYALKHRGL
jgi:hypothetical protein